MIPLSTDVRLKRGLPRAVVGIILGTLLLHVLFDVLKRAGVVTEEWRQDLLTFRYGDPDPVRMVTAVLSHENYWHWAGNMVYLWVFGSILEDRLGPKKFLFLFSICTAAALFLELGFFHALEVLGKSAGWIADHVELEMRSWGASGAVMVIMGLTFSRFPRARLRLGLDPLLPFIPLFRFSVPLWVFVAFTLLKDLFGIFTMHVTRIDHSAHLFGFLTGFLASRLLRLKKESYEETLLDRARESLEAGDFRSAEEDYRRYLELKPDDAEAWRDLGRALMGSQEKRRAPDPGVRGRAAEAYARALELYFSTDRPGEAVALFLKLLGPFQKEDFGPKIVHWVELYGRREGVLGEGLDPASLGRHWERVFRGAAARRDFTEAQRALGELLKYRAPAEMDAAFLEEAGEAALRARDRYLAEKFLQPLAEKGDPRQTARALLVLSRTWLGTPRSLQLEVLYRQALKRVPEIERDHEIVELGEKLKE